MNSLLYCLTKAFFGSVKICNKASSVSSANVATTGKQITFVPKNAVSLWGDYNLGEFVPGLSAGAGMIYQSNLFNADTAPSATAYPLGRIVRIPETFEVDATAAYAFSKMWKAQVNVINLGDRLNYSQSFGNRGTPAPGRTVIFSVEAAL